MVCALGFILVLPSFLCMHWNPLFTSVVASSRFDNVSAKEPAGVTSPSKSSSYVMCQHNNICSGSNIPSVVWLSPLRITRQDHLEAVPGSCLIVPRHCWSKT